MLPDEIRYHIEDKSQEQRYEWLVTAYDQLRVHQLSDAAYARALQFLRQEGDPEQQSAEAESDLAEIREIEIRLSQNFPTSYGKVKRLVSESKLDCMYVARDGGASSLRLGRVIQRM